MRADERTLRLVALAKRARDEGDPRARELIARATRADRDGAAWAMAIQWATEDRDYGEAMQFAQACRADSERAPAVVRVVYGELLRVLGRTAEQVAVWRGTAGEARLPALVAATGDPWFAIELDEARGAPPSDARFSWCIDAGWLDRAAAMIDELGGDDEARAERCIAVGAFERAEAYLVRCGGARALLRRAELSLFRHDAAAARDALGAAQEAEGFDDADGPARAVAVEMGLALAEGDSQRALALGAPHAASSKLVSLRAFHAEALAREGRADEAFDATAEARRLSRRVSIALVLLSYFSRHPRASLDSLRPDTRALVTAICDGDPPPEGALDAALARLGGYREEGLVILREGRLERRVPNTFGPEVGVRYQAILATRGVDALRAAFARDTADPGLAIYHGEVELWLGELERAEAIFRGAIEAEPDTKWAWIGYGACALVGGDALEAMRRWGEVFSGEPTLRAYAERFAGRSISPGPTLWLYLAEAHHHMGEPEEAMGVAGHGLRDKPRRLSALLLVARLAADAGDPSLLDDVCAHVRDALPGLDLALGPRGGKSAIEVHEQMLSLFRGNRSSSRLTWVEGARVGTQTWPGSPPELVERALAISAEAHARHLRARGGR